MNISTPSLELRLQTKSQVLPEYGSDGPDEVFNFLGANFSLDIANTWVFGCFLFNFLRLNIDLWLGGKACDVLDGRRRKAEQAAA